VPRYDHQMAPVLVRQPLKLFAIKGQVPPDAAGVVLFSSQIANFKFRPFVFGWILKDPQCLILLKNLC
jgi:hypothetical protein